MKNSKNYSKNHKNTLRNNFFQKTRKIHHFEIKLGFSIIFIVTGISKSSYLMQCDQQRSTSVFQNI
jgi:hypothetical protein